MSLADLLGKGMDDHGYGSGGEDSPDYDASGKAAMKQFIAAVHAKDSGAAWDALKTAYDLCDKAGDMGPSEPDEGEGGGEPASKGGHALLLVPHGK